ncbi:hypothetical protein BXY66_3377 [Shimia isoporae]|uniref:O-antigen ligase-like membrane protein n=1 Tax=Shimia isoporae TaxID=647720 RepID=A0A4R1N2V1_9RHOB|nr:hypothetical protein [Shimia isoporae]TCL00730.1 hypothetical protein BXY66_3377 [Shimia isoporae]
MPNALATLMLVIWPIVIWRLFVTLPPGRALIWSLLGAYLLLPPPPAAIDFPLMPALDKTSLPNLAILIVAFFVLRGENRPRLMPDSIIARWLLVVFVLSPIVTVFTNPEPLIFTENYIRGLYLQDAIAQPINRFILVIGFLMARQYLTTREDQRDLLMALVIAGLAYSLPILMEVRLSPQLNNWVYGYFQHLFSQTIRQGGYRPMVFLYHGIWLAYFVLTCLLAALALWRADHSTGRAKYMIAAFYLCAVLVLCKTLATLVYAGVAGALILLLTTRMQVKVAALLALITLSYPVLKSADLVPTGAILAQAEAISAERAHSLAFRFENEDILVERAFLKPWFGWGIWGRNHIHDPDTGFITSVSDGYWVIVIGVWGWVGYIAQFGLMSLPIFLVWRELRQASRQEKDRFVRKASYALMGSTRFKESGERGLSPYLGPLALMLGFNLIDLLPNATLTPTTWLIAGTLFGHAERLTRQRKTEAADVPPEGSDTQTVLKRRTVL